ncbi:MAG: hypothetical protein Q8Q59_11110 [Luteolibacter sp.]|jgi:hypothetical protein|nr:hypothetical protein [Luteolibacter sp.]
MNIKITHTKTARKSPAPGFVSIDTTLAARAKRAADARGMSLSEYVDLALENYIASIRNIVPLYGSIRKVR